MKFQSPTSGQIICAHKTYVFSHARPPQQFIAISNINFVTYVQHLALSAFDMLQYHSFTETIFLLFG